MTEPSASRLHHHAYVSADLEATRAFYEDVVGLPLVATWAEDGNPATGDTPYCHCFFGLADGSALAFFQFADPDQQSLNTLPPTNGFDHVALTVTPDAQQLVRDRADAHEVGHFTIDHGYCTSLYLFDPDGLQIELTADLPAAVTPEAEQARRANAHSDLKRWLGGDHTDNNPFRPTH